ncbi:unnamed protein product [Calicophoron daubneyi]|uniref:asparaginase n=1 Tax=Calicophoron daubneyi TaxID=300641 RepID=A0AAV2TST5_CALDB
MSFDSESASMNGKAEPNLQDRRWSMRKIDEYTQASCLLHPAIDPYVLDAALQDPECSAVSSVLVLYTGGTIGMRLVDNAYQPVPNFLTKFLHRVPTFNDPKFKRPQRSLAMLLNSRRALSASHVDSGPQSPTIDPLERCLSSGKSIFALPLSKDGRRIFYSIAEYSPLLDSSDMTMDDWVRIARDIRTYYNYFDGFIILHGTDTLAYTASALSFMLENLAKPVIVTGSQLPLFELRSDGWNNFLGALLLAGGGYHIPEVTVFFHDKLYRGSRVVKRSSSEFHAFASPNYPALAKYGTDMVLYSELVFHPVGVPRPFSIHTDLCRDVTVLNMFPSISAQHVATFLAPPTKGAVIRTYGAGNIPSLRKDLLEVLKAAGDRGVLMINVTQCYNGAVKAIYSTGVILNEFGVIPGYDMTTEAALTKLAYVLGRTDLPDMKSKRALLLRNLRGEVTVQADDAQKANLLPVEYEKIGSAKSMMSYFAHMFTEAAESESDGRGLLWARLMAPAIACSAAASNNVAALKELFAVFGHLQLEDSEGFSALHKAVWYGHLTATQFLLEHAASVHKKDFYGLTPLECAIKSPHVTPELVKLLLDAGAYLVPSDPQLRRTINAAAATGDIRALRLYRMVGCSLENLDDEGRNPLHVAVANRRLEAVKYLVAPKLQQEQQQDGPISDLSGIKDKVTNEVDDTTPTTYNPLVGGAGVDPEILTTWGTTALEEAKIRRFDEIVEVLKEATSMRMNNMHF